MKRSRVFVLLILFTFAFTLYSQGQGNAAATDFQCSGQDTFAAGLNDAGQVVGWFGGAPANPFEGASSFLKKKGGQCEPLPAAPNADATIALGINDPGQIVGIIFPGKNGNGSGFLYEKNTYLTFDYPDAGSDMTQQTCQTFAFSINNRGEIVGLYDRWRYDTKVGDFVCDGPTGRLCGIPMESSSHFRPRRAGRTASKPTASTRVE